MPNEPELLIEIETPIPELIATGAGTVSYLAGSCSHPVQPIRRLEILLDERAHPVLAHSVLRSDVSASSSATDPHDQNLRGRFWAIVPIPPVEAETAIELSLRATLGDGKVVRQQVAMLHLTPAWPVCADAVLLPVLPREDGPLVAICMATYNPPLPLFRCQIRSIREQTYRNWVCVISDDASEPERLSGIREIIGDDARFLVSPAPERLGVYHNFERSLKLAPAYAQYLALADQDDYWHPEKLQTLLAQFDEKTSLVYSDMRVVSECGEVISETCWTARENNYRNFASLLLANTITGAASIFVSQLRDRILPFPPRAGNLFHDHWIACVARARGEVKYVDRPLYDYVQHGGNVIGHYGSAREPLHKTIYWMLLEMKTRQGWQRAGTIYFESVLPLVVMARVILLRGHSELKSGSKRVLRRIARLDSSWLSVAWLFVRGLNNWRPRCTTMGAEYHLLQGIFWKLYISFKSRW
jgi:glycosyltransferase involved in cell wall biosynthesis